VDATKATKIVKEITGAEAIKQEAAQSSDAVASMSAEDVKGAEAVKPETQQSPDTASLPGVPKKIAWRRQSNLSLRKKQWRRALRKKK
jgi:hypothetical protein